MHALDRILMSPIFSQFISVFLKPLLNICTLLSMLCDIVDQPILLEQHSSPSPPPMRNLTAIGTLSVAIKLADASSTYANL